MPSTSRLKGVVLRFFALTALVPFPRLSAQQPPMPVADLVRTTVHNELHPANPDAKYMFRERKETLHGLQSKLIVETRDAMAGMLIAIDDKPLTAEQREAEDARLERFVKDPDELQKKMAQEKADSERIERIMTALPDAFIYEYDGNEPGREGVGKAGDQLVRLRFRPNPKYDPPSRVEQVLTAMQGQILIDAKKRRIAKIDGTLQNEVGFGWGILGHLDRGGHFLVEQGDVGDGHFEITRMNLAFTGKILFFKSLNFKSNEVESDFHSVPGDLTFAQGLELLKKQEALLAQNGSQASPQQK